MTRPPEAELKPLKIANDADEHSPAQGFPVHAGLTPCLSHPSMSKKQTDDLLHGTRPRPVTEGPTGRVQSGLYQSIFHSCDQVADISNLKV